MCSSVSPASSRCRLSATQSECEGLQVHLCAAWTESAAEPPTAWEDHDYHVILSIFTKKIYQSDLWTFKWCEQMFTVCCCFLEKVCFQHVLCCMNIFFLRWYYWATSVWNTPGQSSLLSNQGPVPACTTQHKLICYLQLTQLNLLHWCETCDLNQIKV